MTREEQLACLTDRPCSVCKHHTEEGCCKWSCVFEEEPDDAENKGEWIEVVTEETEYSKTWHYECSVCGKWNPCCGDIPNYCPNCGADMRGE